MRGSELVAAIEREGFAITRRSSTCVWLARDDQTLLVDVNAELPDVEAEAIMAQVRERAR